jgi:glycerol-3-phosphate O-acyltransferase
MKFLTKIDLAVEAKQLPKKYAVSMKSFYETYRQALIGKGDSIENYESIFNVFLELVLRQIESPYPFEPYHRKIREPFDYYAFGLDLLRPLVIFEKSRVLGLEHVDAMQACVDREENVILFANHQTEPDPQAISLLLEKEKPLFGEEMIFVAGQRVIADPLAVPFSMGRNLLCIYSKKHMEHPIEQKHEKQLHNQRVMKQMALLLSEGGKCIYVAPSGGRDRPDSNGFLEVAPFDPQSIEMFWLMAQQSKKITHFYTLALSTYKLLPPPCSVECELGESRITTCTPIHMAFGKEIPMKTFPGSEGLDKRALRSARATYIWEQVKHDYMRLTEAP